MERKKKNGGKKRESQFPQCGWNFPSEPPASFLSGCRSPINPPFPRPPRPSRLTAQDKGYFQHKHQCISAGVEDRT